MNGDYPTIKCDIEVTKWKMTAVLHSVTKVVTIRKKIVKHLTFLSISKLVCSLIPSAWAAFRFFFDVLTLKVNLNWMLHSFDEQIWSSKFFNQLAKNYFLYHFSKKYLIFVFFCAIHYKSLLRTLNIWENCKSRIVFPLEFKWCITFPRSSFSQKAK